MTNTNDDRCAPWVSALLGVLFVWCIVGDPWLTPMRLALWPELCSEKEIALELCARGEIIYRAYASPPQNWIAIGIGWAVYRRRRIGLARAWTKAKVRAAWGRTSTTIHRTGRPRGFKVSDGPV